MYTVTKSISTEPVEDFFESLTELHEDVYDRLTPSKEMDLSDVEQKSFDNATCCYVCNCKFKFTKDGLKNRDHTNLKMRVHLELNIYCHNLKG
jgi:hypothetical protein